MIETPEELHGELYPHQKRGVWWMQKMEKSDHRGGLLCDEMVSKISYIRMLYFII